MDWKVVFSVRSKKDLQEIVEFIDRDDAGAAQRFYRPDTNQRVFRFLRLWHAARRQRSLR